MTATITIRDSQGFIAGLPPWEEPLDGEGNPVKGWIDPLTAATSFRPEGYQYTTAYAKGKTDGRVKLLKPGGKFPAGLLSTVTATLDKQKIDYEVIVENSEDVKPRIQIQCIDIESRWYQDEAVEAGILNPRGTIQVPTGGGKTAIGARLVAERGRWTLWVTPTIDLLHQTRAFLEQHLIDVDQSAANGFGRVPIGQLGDGVVEPQPITVATVRTAAAALSVAYERYEYGEYDDTDNTDVDPKKLKEWAAKIGTLVVDESHILGAQTVYDLATKLKCPNKYGFSASPWRDDGADLMLTAATGPRIYRVGTEVLVTDGYLVPPVIEVVNTRGWWKPARWGQVCARCGVQRGYGPQGVPKQKCDHCQSTRWRSEYTDAYRQEIVENPVRNWRISERVKALDGATLVLVKQVKHGKLLQQMLPGSVFLSGKDGGDFRTQTINQLRVGLIDTLIATTIADLGLDVPALRNLVLAGGGKSSTRHLQRIGRVARPYPGKDFARVIDFDDSHVHRWFRDHQTERRKIERAEWAQTAIWI